MGLIFFVAEIDLEQQIINLALRTVIIASISLVFFIITAVLLKNHMPKLKLPLFVLIAVTMLGSTGILIASTVYLNTKADSKGPVHWHADIEFWSCGAELNLRDPQGMLTNKVGTATYHEHNDKRIHLEGVVVRKSHDASLGKFMQVTGGHITPGSVAIPLSRDQDKWFASGDQVDGDTQRPQNFSLATGAGAWVTNDEKGPVLSLGDGEYCGEGDESPAEVQVFAYHYDEASKTYSQRKVDDPADYVIRDESVVPPADCIIVEYDQPKERTDKLCRQYGVRDALRCTYFGVKEFNSELCNIREVAGDGGQ